MGGHGLSEGEGWPRSHGDLIAYISVTRTPTRLTALVLPLPGWPLSPQSQDETPGSPTPFPTWSRTHPLRHIALNREMREGEKWKNHRGDRAGWPEGTGRMPQPLTF